MGNSLYVFMRIGCNVRVPFEYLHCINPKQATQAADIAHDCVEARVPVWSTGGKPQIAVFQADPQRLEVDGAADAIAKKPSN